MQSGLSPYPQKSMGSVVHMLAEDEDWPHVHITAEAQGDNMWQPNKYLGGGASRKSLKFFFKL